jgi:hypothetical protein
VTLDGTDGNIRDQRTGSSPTLATDSLVPCTAKPLRVSRTDWVPCLVRNLGRPTRRPLRLPDRESNQLRSARRASWQACTSATEATSASHARSGVCLTSVTTLRWTSLSLSFSSAANARCRWARASLSTTRAHPNPPASAWRWLGVGLMRSRYLTSMPPSIGGRCDKLTTTVQPSHVVSVQLVFVTKDRRGVLGGQHLDALGTVSASVCADVGAELVELEGVRTTTVTWLGASRRRSRSPDRWTPSTGVSARRLRQRDRVPHPPGAPVVAVVAGGLGWWHAARDPQACCRQERTPGRPG